MTHHTSYIRVRVRVRVRVGIRVRVRVGVRVRVWVRVSHRGLLTSITITVLCLQRPPDLLSLSPLLFRSHTHTHTERERERQRDRHTETGNVFCLLYI